jgi:hypothetical protein
MKLHRFANLANQVCRSAHAAAAKEPRPADRKNIGQLADVVSMRRGMGLGSTNQSDAGRVPGGKLKLATCQFHIGTDIRENVEACKAQIKAAALQGADLVHFSETCLSGYAGVEHMTFEGYDWATLVAGTEEICALARELRVWVVVGSAHRLSGDAKPHNSLYVINDRGAISRGRYIHSHTALYISLVIRHINIQGGVKMSLKSCTPR